MIFVMRQIQKCIEQNKPLYSVFIDLRKAFDSVNREAHKGDILAAFAISNGCTGVWKRSQGQQWKSYNDIVTEILCHCDIQPRELEAAAVDKIYCRLNPSPFGLGGSTGGLGRRSRGRRKGLGAAMMEGSDDGPDFLSEEDRGLRAVTVDLQTDAALQVDISDALSERDKVKFTVHTKSSLPNFKQNEFSVVRQHEEFIWLHDSFVENEDYAGYIIPPAPPRPDFDASREKLQKLGEGEGSMTKEEFTKMKQELEAEYLAIFKKTVAMHEVFLCRVAAHPILRKDLNFHVFLEYNQDLSVRGKNKKEKLEDFFKNMVKSADGVIVSGVKDVDDFFEHERTFLVEYHNRVKDSSLKSDKMTRSHKNVADDYNRIGSSLYALGTQDSTDICKFFLKVSELFDKTRKIEARVSADEDLKLSDLLKYYLRESQAAKDLLYRRSRSLVDYENANKALDKARAKNKDVLQAENTQQLCCHKFEKISESAKQELIDFKTRRVAAFRKNLVELAELELKHAKGNLQLLQSCLAVLNGDT
ncbi:sorting nexin-6 [Protobothrops mucrosquamatus]|uniref:sorting nexin-6 n=2 Tax=Protobothrops mucrosquamatus TaxID=103944 RepID=UPI000775C16E|nr:sorting nexin-6 [Protobothrops mucrosquamatus]